VDGLLALRATATLVSGGTGLTLYKEEVAPLVPAVGMCIGRLTTLMAMGDDIITDTFSQPVVKDEVLS